MWIPGLNPHQPHLKPHYFTRVAKHAQITQSNKFSISLKYLKKEVIDEVDFLHADRDKNYLQIDTMTFDGDGQAFPKFPKMKVCSVFTIS